MERGAAIFSVAALTTLALVGCDCSVIDRVPGHDGALEVRDTAPAGGAEVVVEVDVVRGRLYVHYPSGLNDYPIIVPVGAWVDLDFVARSPGEESAAEQRLHLPELGWTLPIPPGPGVHRFVRARRPFDETAPCVQDCEDSRATMRVAAQSREAWDVWVQHHRVVPAGMSVPQWGTQLLGEHGCTACHGSIASDLQGLWGETRMLPSGEEIVVRGEVGEHYVRSWIQHPERYQGPEAAMTMPSFESMVVEQVDAILDAVRCGDVEVCPAEPALPE